MRKLLLIAELLLSAAGCAEPDVPMRAYSLTPSADELAAPSLTERLDELSDQLEELARKQRLEELWDED
ncbi:MAG: hypothetical protein DMG76_23650 [Acidobacteria bacterium]|nr:MAG: hypothetical protein DMG76_23650 [Acidobacteriota bacterium]